MPYIKIPLSNILSVDKIVSVYDYDLSAGFRYEGESHDFWELLYVREGRVKVGSGEHVFEPEAGFAVFHRPHRFHFVRCGEDCGARVVIIGFETRSSAMEIFGDRTVCVSPSDARYIDDVISAASVSFVPGVMPLTPSETAPIGSVQLLRLALEGLLIRLLQAESGREKRPVLFTDRVELEARLAEDISSYLDDNVYSRLSMDDVSRHFHFGKSHLSHIFKAYTGRSIIDTFIDKKVERAMLLLCDTEDTVSAIAERLSFESPQYFAKQFKRRTGKSPTEYRLSLLGT